MLAKRPNPKMGDTRDTDFCGNWFPREESIDNRGTERREGNRSLSKAYWTSLMNTGIWQISGASLRIPSPRPAYSIDNTSDIDDSGHASAFAATSM